MSFRVLVIPEDPTHNGYILRPLVDRMLAEVGKPEARVQLLTNPKLGGYDHAVRAIRHELPARYRFYDLWLFLPDADRAQGAEAIEAELKQQGIRLLVCPAKPEVEAWLLAGHREKLPLPFSDLRNHPRLKEEIFEPFLKNHGNPRSAGTGREALMRETLGNYRTLLQFCPELADLEQRLRGAVQEHL